MYMRQHDEMDIPKTFLYLTFVSRNYPSVTCLTLPCQGGDRKFQEEGSSRGWAHLPQVFTQRFFLVRKISELCLRRKTPSALVAFWNAWLLLLECYLRSAAAIQSRSCHWCGGDESEEMFSNAGKQNVHKMKRLFPCSEQRKMRISWAVQGLGVLGFGLRNLAGVWLPQCPSWHNTVVTHRGIRTQLSSPSCNGYKYDSWNLPNNRQEQYSQQAGGEQLSMKETPAEVGIHCFLLMFITAPISGKNRLLAFKNNFLPSLYGLEESVLLEHSFFGDRENCLSAWVKFHLWLLSSR